MVAGREDTKSSYFGKFLAVKYFEIDAIYHGSRNGTLYAGLQDSETLKDSQTLVLCDYQEE